MKSCLKHQVNININVFENSLSLLEINIDITGVKCILSHFLSSWFSEVVTCERREVDVSALDSQL